MVAHAGGNQHVHRGKYSESHRDAKEQTAPGDAEVFAEQKQKEYQSALH